MKENEIYEIDVFDGFKELDDKSVNHILTSPPYNRKRNDKYNFYDDTEKDYYGFLCKVLDECLRVTKGYVFFNIQKTYYNKKEVFKLLGKYNNKIKEVIIWQKKNPMPAAGNAITNSYEFIIVLSDKSLKSNHTYTKNIISTSVNGDMPSIHKAVMKQEVSDWIISNFTLENQLILDCFMGTGTTALSCLHYNRNYLGFEISQEYCKLAKDRLNNSTKR